MAKIRLKYNHDEVYEVYGAREEIYQYNEYEQSWTESHTEFLVYQFGSWEWVDAKNYEPVKEGV